MKEFTYTVKNEVGIHARPAAMLNKFTKGFKSRIMLEKDGRYADAGRLIRMMSLGVKCGDMVRVTVEGEDEEAAYEAVLRFFDENL